MAKRKRNGSARTQQRVPKVRIARPAKTNRTAIYLRKSTAKAEQNASLPRQRGDCQQYAERHGLVIVGEYEERATSGVNSTGRRPKWQQLVRDAETGKFDNVLVWQMSRITRSDMMDAMGELIPLRDAGVKLFTTDKGHIAWHEMAGQLQLTIEAISNNQYSAKIADGSASGQMKVAKSGRWANGKPPFGYVNPRGEDGRPTGILQPGRRQDVDLVREMFRMYANGHSLRSVAKRAGRGLTWVRYVLGNPAYAGTVAWNRTRQGKFRAIRNGAVTSAAGRGVNDPEDWIITKNAHLAIVDGTTFDKVQAMFETRRRGNAPHANGGGFILTGLMRCGDCGATMVGMNNGGRVLYRCSTYMTGGADTCHAHNVWQDEVLGSIVEAIEATYDAATVTRLKSHVRDKLAARQAAGPDVRQLRRDVKAAETRATKSRRRMADCPDDLLEETRETYREHRAELQQLQSQLASVESPAVSTAKTSELVDAAMAEFHKLRGLVDRGDPVLVRNWIRTHIGSLTVDVERRKAGSRYRYTFTGGTAKGPTNNPSSSW